MHDWIENSFGSVDAVREQRIVKVTNLVTLQGTLFNELRSSRPSDTGTDLDLEREIEKNLGDPFCHPEDGTPADTFGRVRGRHSTTASNIAKYDGFHGVIVFDDHNPLHFTREKVADYINVGLQWGRKAIDTDPEARYFFLMWNCLWRAGGSLIHGHAQATATRNMHYPKVEHLRRTSLSYAAEHGSNYFDDLYDIHDSLGLSFPCPGNIRGFANLTPVKERELILIGDSLEDASLHQAVADALESYVKALGVSSFNVAFYAPPLTPDGRDWSEFPDYRASGGPGRSGEPHLRFWCDGTIRRQRGRLGPVPGSGGVAMITTIGVTSVPGAVCAGYIQPFRSAKRAASTRLRVPSFLMAVER